ncbi:MAG: diacylglycerol kinase family lipid kinase [Candidatus Eremiobacteraeota bacterium]|nr:diacylglycerol kinase family lipid kinase [Candidatus Eremiobacteraeota bacterium]
MAVKQDSQKQLLGELEDARTKHRRLAKKLEATKAKLEKRTRKLCALESKIAKLEQRAHERATAPVERATKGNGSLRVARLIFNPGSGADSKDPHALEKIVDLLRAHGLRAKVDIRTSGKTVRHFAKAAADNKEELVIVAGGDGTIEEAASQLVGTKTALGILPVGTMNNVARSLGIPLDLDDACALLGAGSTRQVDMGRVITDEKQDGDYFLESVGLGLTAIAFSAGKAVRKGRLAGLPNALRKLFDSKPGPVQIDLDNGETILANSQLVTVSNAPLMGLNFLVAPAAKMDDAVLDVAVYDGMGKGELLDYFLKIRGGKRAENPKVAFYQARKVRIQCQDDAPTESDSHSLRAQKVLNVEVVPQALSMIVGKGIALNVPIEAVQSVPPLSGPQPKSPNENGAVKAEAKEKLERE